jgi:predicted nucleic acid-binding protein
LAARPAEELRRLERISGLVRIVYPDRAFAVMFGRVAVELRTAGAQIPLMDLMIGTHALCLGLPLLTRDTEHFQRIPNLVVETY